MTSNSETFSVPLIAVDPQGSVINHQGNLFTYTPYGADQQKSTGSSYIGYTGLSRMSFGGYMPGSYRRYDPLIMRFTSPDSFSPFGEGGLNSYCYASNDPMNNIDLSGHVSFKWLKNIFGRSRRKIENLQPAKAATTEANTLLASALFGTGYSKNLPRLDTNPKNIIKIAERIDIAEINTQLEITRTVSKKNSKFAKKHGIDVQPDNSLIESFEEFKNAAYALRNPERITENISIQNNRNNYNTKVSKIFGPYKNSSKYDD
ncbi:MULTISPECIES: RHS repeat-associated core domain-containing protein [unclassified Pseudomonas]|jgi:RHS repeat-associated protein|uniref:RHS repeat-associated core domain-containing protein n=1 Tax=unclassified Pseudomonas TaxID=196821 RepID=UPI001E337B51|nr:MULTISPECIES: RHS repeat-associated core domain-containing protein [unclassified Pseudomonas]MCE0913880.1 RHS repeat-associated core domain-containing protein [Pseudomonas sp. NMI760_13]MCP8636676.1 RHS repeat-associated core domain-containing protein [Pseudomonas sp. DVZ6]MDD7784047.1 RHS repeat-associated core domain-containing protein [Pseudomonas sp. DVZ24]